MTTPDIVGVVLAAPPSRPEAEYQGRPVLATVLDMVAGWELAAPVIVVFGPDTEHLAFDIDLGDAVAVVDVDGRSRASALSVGLDAVTRLVPDAEAALLVDGDVPAVPSGAALALIDELASSGKAAAAPVYRYVRGGPVVVARRLWDRLMTVEGDQPIHELLSAHPDWTATVVISERAPASVG